MRNHRRRTKPANPAVKTVLLRILFVLGAAAVITVLTVLTGHHLLAKVASAEADPIPTGGTGIQFERDDDGDGRNVGSAPNIRGVGMDLLSYDSLAEIASTLDELSAAYNTVIFPLCDEDGQLIYQSPAVCALVRMQPTESEAMNRIVDSIREAKTRGMRVVASLLPAESAADAALMQELASFGVTEILVVPALSGTLDYETANRLRLYLNECQEALDGACRLGIVLPAAAYLDSEGAMQLQMIAQTASSLGIRFPTAALSTPDEVYAAVSDTIQSLMGTFSVYNMRVELDETNPYRVAASYQACADRGVTNYFFTGTVKAETLNFTAESANPSEDVVSASGPAIDIPDSVVNPYATTRDSYEENTPEPPVIDDADDGRQDAPTDWNVSTEPQYPAGTDWNAYTEPQYPAGTDWNVYTEPQYPDYSDWNSQSGQGWGSDWYDDSVWSGGGDAGYADGTYNSSDGIVTGTPPAEFIDENGNWTGWMDSYGEWHPNGGW